MSDQRKSPNVIYVGDIVDKLPWDYRNPTPGGPWRYTAVHPLPKVESVA